MPSCRSQGRRPRSRVSFRLLPYVIVDEVHHRFPVVVRNLVFAGTEVIANGALDQLPGHWRGHFGNGKAVGTKQAVDRIGGECGEEFSLGIGMQVVLG